MGVLDTNRFLHFVEKFKITSAVLVPVMMQWLATEIDKVNCKFILVLTVAHLSIHTATATYIRRMLENFLQLNFYRFIVTETTGG